MSFNRPTGAFDQRLAPIVTKDAKHIGDVTLNDEFAINDNKADQIISALRHVAETGKMATRFGLGLKLQYDDSQSGEIHLKGIDLKNPMVSKTFATITFRKGHEFTTDQITALMNSFIRPDEQSHDPSKKPKGPKTPKA
jgi:hypothetical protein